MTAKEQGLTTLDSDIADTAEVQVNVWMCKN